MPAIIAQMDKHKKAGVSRRLFFSLELRCLLWSYGFISFFHKHSYPCSHRMCMTAMRDYLCARKLSCTRLGELKVPVDRITVISS
jgi:hypothetical protein